MMKNLYIVRTVVLLIALSLLLTILFISCAGKQYDEKWIIGKTYSEILDKYGEFDIYSYPERIIDGMCYNAGCGYLTKEGQPGFLGTPPDEFYMIYFDSNGLAYEVEEDVPRLGG